MRSPRSVSTTSIPCASRCAFRPHSSVSIDLLFTTRAAPRSRRIPSTIALCSAASAGPVHVRRRARVRVALELPRGTRRAARARGARMAAARSRRPPTRAAPRAAASRRARTCQSAASCQAARSRVGEEERRGGRVALAAGARSRGGPRPARISATCITRSGQPRRSARPRRWRRHDASTEVSTSAPAASWAAQAVEAHAAGDVRLVHREAPAEAAALVGARGRHELEPAERCRAARAHLVEGRRHALGGAREAELAQPWQLGCRPTRCGKRPAIARTPSTSTRNSQSSWTRARERRLGSPRSAREVAAHHRDAASRRADDVVAGPRRRSTKRRAEAARLGGEAGRRRTADRSRSAPRGSTTSTPWRSSTSAVARPTSGQSWST